MTVSGPQANTPFHHLTNVIYFHCQVRKCSFMGRLSFFHQLHFHLPNQFKGKTYWGCFLFPFIFLFLLYDKGNSCFLFFFSGPRKKKLLRKHKLKLKKKKTAKGRRGKQHLQAGHCVNKQEIFSTHGTDGQTYRNTAQHAHLKAGEGLGRV